MAPTDNIVKDKANEHTGHVVQECRLRHVGHAGEDNWEVEILEEINPEPLVQNPLEYWCKGANQEEEKEAKVELSV